MFNGTSITHGSDVDQGTYMFGLHKNPYLSIFSSKTHTCQGILMSFVCMQGLYKKEWKLLALQITQSRRPISVADLKTSKFNSQEIT